MSTHTAQSLGCACQAGGVGRPAARGALELSFPESGLDVGAAGEVTEPR